MAYAMLRIYWGAGIVMADFTRELHDNISQRAIASYLRGIGNFAPAAGNAEEETSQRQLYEFLQALYTRMYEQPALFGLPVTPDDALLLEDEHSERKQEVMRKLKRPREILSEAIDLLRELGCRGRLRGEELVLADAEYENTSQTKVRQAILKGLRESGLAIASRGGEVTARAELQPLLLHAWKELAEACARNPDQKLAAFNFASCAFRALSPEYLPDAVGLLTFFTGANRARAMQLHEFLLAEGYRAGCRVCSMHAWDIQYQGPRKIKGSPLLAIYYDERRGDPLQVHLKCASVDRLLPSFPAQPEAVRDDFHSRLFPCRGSACGWCRDRKGLGPSVLEHENVRITACWYTRPDLDKLDEASLEVLRGYVLWHQELLRA